MMKLNDFERNFLEQAKPRLLEELAMFANFDYLGYSNLDGNENKEEIVTFRKMFLLNSFLELTGSLFFMSHSVFDQPINGKSDRLMNAYINFCKRYDSIPSISR